MVMDTFKLFDIIFPQKSSALAELAPKKTSNINTDKTLSLFFILRHTPHFIRRLCFDFAQHGSKHGELSRSTQDDPERSGSTGSPHFRNHTERSRSVEWVISLFLKSIRFPRLYRRGTHFP